MPQFDSLTPDPSYTIEVNGETREISPDPDADRIVIDTDTQQITEYQTATADIGTSYTESSYGGSRTYNPKSFGPSAQQWHKEVQNMSFEYYIYASAWEYDGSSSNYSYIDIEITFSSRENVNFSKRVDVESSYGDSESESKSGTVDVGDGIIESIRIRGAGPRTDYDHAVEYNIARVSFTADVPVETPQATLNDVTIVGGRSGGG
jgi:hypothetical protein